MMTGLRTALVAGVAAALLSVPGAVTAASAEDEAAREPGCAKLGGYGYGWADIRNACGHTISATVEVDGWDPDCIQIGPGSVGCIGVESDDEPYYAYEC